MRALPKKLPCGVGVPLHENLLFNNVTWRMHTAINAMAVMALVARAVATVAAHEAHAFIHRGLSLTDFALCVDVAAMFLLAEFRDGLVPGKVRCSGAIRKCASRH